MVVAQFFNGPELDWGCSQAKRFGMEKHLGNPPIGLPTTIRKNVHIRCMEVVIDGTIGIQDLSISFGQVLAEARDHLSTSGKPHGSVGSE